MLSKLLDEPYWNEFDSRLDNLYAKGPHCVIVSESGSISLSSITQSLFGDYIYVHEKNEGRQKLSLDEVKKRLKKDDFYIEDIKESLLFELEYGVGFFLRKINNEINELKKILEKENNVELIFQALITLRIESKSSDWSLEQQLAYIDLPKKKYLELKGWK